MNSTIEEAKTERKRVLTMEEQLERATGSGGSSAYVPGEKWRNNKQYLAGDSVKDGNGNLYTALQNSLNKTPANHPEYWKPEPAPVITAWANDPVGTQYYDGTTESPQSYRHHNSKDWKCIQTHTKTAGNGPRQGSDLWAEL